MDKHLLDSKTKRKLLPHKKPTDKKKSSNEFMKYGGMATSLFVIMFVMWWIGNQIDEYIGNEQPYIGLLFIVVSLFAYFYKLIKDLS